MRAILWFTLPEERAEFRWAQTGHSYWRALCDFSDKLRKIRKYEAITEEQGEFLERITKEFYERLEDNGIHDLIEEGE